MIEAVDSEVFIDLVTGSGLGTFVGDALGMPVEGLTAREIAALYGRLEEMLPGRLPAGSYTDDTQMMVAILEGLVEDGAFNPGSVAMRFVASFEPVRGYGRRIAGVMSRLSGGAGWRDAGTDSFGNGAAMRIAPIGLFFHGDVDALVAAAKDCSIITHQHPEGVAGGVAQALGVALALKAGLGMEKPDPGEFIREIASRIKEIDPGFAARLMDLMDVDPKRLGPELHRLFRCNLKAVESVGPALACFLYTEGFEDALLAAVNLGGDTDTIGAMTGALAGAFYGRAAIPGRWLDALEEGKKGRSYVEELLFRLAQICPR